MSESATLPNNWESVRLADHTTVKARLGWKGLKAEEYVEDGYIFLATPNLKANQIDFDNVNYITKWRYDESPEIQLHVGDVLIVKDGSTLGISNFVRHLPSPTSVNGSIAVVRTRSSLYPEFLYHLVNGDAFQQLIALKKAGLGVPHLFQADLREFFVPLPPLPQQRKIARILTTLDNLIEKTEALIAKYQAIKQGMMHDLFTRGVDANGKLRPPQSEAPELYKQSEQGWIPKEWEVRRVGDHLERIEPGWSPECETEPASAGEWGVLKTTSVVWEGFNGIENKRLPRHLSPLSQYEVQVDDVLMTRGGPNSRVGVVAHVQQTTDKLMLSDKIYRLVPKKGLLPRYLALALSSGRTQTHLSTLKTGLAESQTNISQEIVRRLWIGLPELGEQQRSCKRIEVAENVLSSERKSLAAFYVIKSGLMQDLLTGKVPVKADDAESFDGTGLKISQAAAGT